jgi:hypothetical protein
MPLHPFPGVLAVTRSRVSRTAGAGYTTDGTHTTPSTGHTWGTPTELIASTPFDSVAVTFRLLTAISVSGARSDSLLQLYVGGSGSEQSVIGPVLFGGRVAGSSLTLPIAIPAGSRVSFAVKSARTSLALTAQAEVFGAPNVHTTGLPTRWVAYGLGNDSASASWGTAVTAGNAAWGSWTSLTTSTTYPHDLWLPMLDNGTAVVTANQDLRSQFALASTTDAATEAANGTAWEGPWKRLTATEQYMSMVTYGWAVSMGAPWTSDGIVYAPRAAGSAVSVRAACSVSPAASSTGAAILGAVM